jgi:hypothetical protein
MTLRKLVGVVPVVAALALAAPVAGASAQSPGSTIPCYPYPAFCGPNGQPWFAPLPSPFQIAPLTGPTFGPGPVQLPTPVTFGPGPVQIP